MLIHDTDISTDINDSRNNNGNRIDIDDEEEENRNESSGSSRSGSVTNLDGFTLVKSFSSFENNEFVFLFPFSVP